MIKVNFEIQTAFHNTHKPIGKQNNKYSTVLKKDSNGKERKYLYATSSGSLYRDAHNEKMTERCIKGFQEQAQTKTIYLLHPHDENILANHIGKLEGDQSYIDENGEWKTVFRFWDDEDLKHDIPSALVARAKDAWNSITGQGVYDGKPSALRQLSIQGLIDENKDIIQATDGSGGRNLDWIELSCISLVEKGAYPQENITPVEKVFKQLYDSGKIQKKDTLLGKLIKEENMEEDFRNQLARLEDKFNMKMHEILTDETLDPAMSKANADNLVNEYATEYKKLLGIIQYKLSEDDMALKTKDETQSDEMKSKGEDEVSKAETDVVKDELLMKPLSEMSDEEKAQILELLSGGATKSKKKEETETEKEEDEVSKAEGEEVEKARLEKSKRKIKSIKKEINLIKDSINKSKIKKQEVNPELVGRLADLIDDLNEVSSMLTGTGDVAMSKEEGEVEKKEGDEVSKEEESEDVAKDSESDAETLGDTTDMDDPDAILDVMEKKLGGIQLSAVMRSELKQKILAKKLSPAIKSELSTMKSEMAAMRKQLTEAVTINKSLVEAIEEVSGQQIMKAVDVRVNKSLDERLLDELAKNPAFASRINKSNESAINGKAQNDFDFIKKSLSPFKGGR